jgi:Ca-activated chloride channel family protein
MNEHSIFCLASRDTSAPAPVLTGVQASGRLDGVLFELTLRQTYRNTSERNLEVVYTFPLPHQAVLLGFASELNGGRKVGAIVAKREAEHRYEQALADGDAPVMLEAPDHGLHTANIGNLQPGDEIVLEARFAQLLRFEQGRLRIAIPTTIAPRYGHANQAGLQSQQVSSASLQADHALALSITIGRSLAGAKVDCPTHRWTSTPAPAGQVRLDLAADARLDRDVVIVVTPREPRAALVTTAHDEADAAAPTVVMAAFAPLAAAPREHITIKLLVDCSGSMGGDSIASARAAVRGVVKDLGDTDTLSLSCFGSTVKHLCEPTAATPRSLRFLRPLIDTIDADLGGTEMQDALDAVFKLRRAPDGGTADVLLITDGEIWQVDTLVAAARASGHRVFAIGVGSAPAEGFLRTLAEATDGACEFVTPGEALEAAARRMVFRMRQPSYTNLRVDWGVTPVWQQRLPSGVFAGDTVLALAGFADAPSASGSALAIRMLADVEQGATTVLAKAEGRAHCPGDQLPRLAAAQRLGECGDDKRALDLALRYQLMSKRTNCILVHAREDADKATRPAELRQVDIMLPAGWGATGTVFRQARMAPAPMICDPMGTITTGSSHDSGVSEGSADISIKGLAEIIRTAPWSMANQATEAAPPTLAAMAEWVVLMLDTWGDLQAITTHRPAQALHADAQHALDDAVQLGVDINLAWLLLAHWVNTCPGGLADAQVTATLQPFLAAITPELVARVSAIFDRRLAAYPLDGWTLSRAGRLRGALSRAG